MQDTQIPKLRELFRNVFHAHKRAMRHTIDRHGLHALTNPGILFMLHCHGGDEGISQKEIADRLEIAPPTAAVSIKRMEKSGLITKQADQQDLRRNRIALTEEGDRLVEQYLEVEKELFSRMVDGFSTQELELMQDYFRRMIQNLGTPVCHHFADRPEQAPEDGRDNSVMEDTR